MKKILYILMLVLMIEIAQATYNTTSLSTANTIYAQTYELNQLLYGLPGLGLLIIVFVITYVIVFSNTANNLSGLVGASFWSTVSASIMLPLGLIGFPIFQGVLLIFAGSFFARIIIK